MEIKAITIFTDECYRCNSDKFDHVHKFIIKTDGVSLSVLKYERAGVDPSRTDEIKRIAKRRRLSFPFIEVITGDNAKYYCNASDFDKLIAKIGRKYTEREAVNE